MASLVGVNVDRTISYTFVIGAALAAVAGIMHLLYYGVVDFYIGFVAGVKAFTAAVLGGIGSLPGAMIGGLLIGLALISQAAGQSPVKACWNKFAPTNTVSHTNPGCTSCVNTTDNSTMNPANASTPRSIDMYVSSIDACRDVRRPFERGNCG